MSRLEEALKAGAFVVTAELNPPKGMNLDPLLQKAEALKDRVTAFNLTDSHTARMSTAPMAVARLLLEQGMESILQLTCRDRNRIALQSDLLGAAVLGVSNVLCMGGDNPAIGDHPEAKAVFDLDSVTLLEAVSALDEGHDLSGNQLRGTPKLFAGAVANPGADDLELEIDRMGQKIEAGAKFFQTQAVYDVGDFEMFTNATAKYQVPILASIIMLKSGDMARFLTENVPGIVVPDGMIREMDETSTPEEKSVEIAARTIHQIRPMCQGVHLIAAGWESRLPLVLDAAKIAL